MEPLTILFIAIAAGLGAVGGFSLSRSGGGSQAESNIDSAPAEAKPNDAAALMRLPTAVMLIDSGLRVTLANPAANAIFGAPGSEARLATYVRSPDFLEAAQNCLTGLGDQELVFNHLRSKEERPILAKIRLISAEEAEPRAIIQFEDQTRERRVEALRETFIANASHELKTPLASIIGFIETLQGPAREDAKARDRFLAIMATQADRMRRLVDDLMSLNRIELNVHNRPREIIDLGALAHETAAALEPVADNAGARIVVDAPEEGPFAPGDRDQLAQLLTNLMDNAVKYGGSDAVVRVSVAEPQPEWPGMVGLTIADNGPGIPREHLPRLTERFYRVDAARSRAVGGTGLGLAIAKHIMQRHRGELSVRSKPGEGAAFTAWLPKTE